MFIYSIRASSIKFFGILGLATALLIVLIFALPTTGTVSTGSFIGNESSVSYTKIKTEEARKEFLKQFGWETANESKESAEITIPNDFDKILQSYNDIQKNQGLDLSKYKGKTVTRYTYEVTNYPEYKGTVYANIIIYKNKVVGGDICSSDIDGFIHGFEKPISQSK